MNQTAFIPGVQHCLAAHTYHAIHALSSTYLKRMRQSMLHAQHDLDFGTENDDMRLGTAVHTRLLEPAAYKVDIAVMPKFDRRTTEGKAKYAEFMDATADKTVISEDDHVSVLGMEQAFQESNAASGTLELCQEREVSLFAIDPDTGVRLKARLDAFDPVTGWIVDIKTVRDASMGAFRNALRAWGWAVQAAFYRKVARLAGLTVNGFAFICIEKTAPHGIATYSMSEADMDLLDMEIRRLIVEYKVASERGVFPGYPDTVQKIGLANWYRNELENAIGGNNDA